jgi:hypothetical protein
LCWMSVQIVTSKTVQWTVDVREWTWSTGTTEVIGKGTTFKTVPSLGLNSSNLHNLSC